MKKYIKKVNVYSTESSVEARAERLRRLRNMANLTRDEMCNMPRLNINTYKGWEIARYGGLPADGAQKVIDRIAQEGVICTTDWLLHGVGMTPHILPEYQKPDSLEERPEFKSPTDKDYILNEIQLFKKHFPQAIFFEVEDDGVMPIYRPGDFLAGIPCNGEHIQNLVGEICIIETADGITLVRKIEKHNHLNQYTLTCMNTSTTVPIPTLQDVPVSSATPIFRAYRRTGTKI